jgi:cytochrome b561
MAALVAACFGIGLIMVDLPIRALAAKILAYQLHKSLGLLLPPLLAWRLWLRARHVAPPASRAARIGQGALYALLLAVPLLGYLVASAAPGGVPTTLFLLIPVPHALATDPALHAALVPIHRAAAWALVGLALGHAALAVAHHRAGQPTLRAMWRG